MASVASPTYSRGIWIMRDTARRSSRVSCVGWRNSPARMPTLAKLALTTLYLVEVFLCMRANLYRCLGTDMLCGQEREGVDEGGLES